MQTEILQTRYSEANSRKLIKEILDKDSFVEIFLPTKHIVSPHLKMINKPVAFDDGVVIGSGKINNGEVYIAAQEGGFSGGTIGEIHGAKLVGLIRRAVKNNIKCVIIALNSGGVRLEEANIGLIAAGEFNRAVLDARSNGVNCIAMIGGSVGCYGGAALAAKCFDYVIMNEKGRLGISGPVVIETAKGVEEFDSQDKAMVWRTYGGKNRFILKDADFYVEDSVNAFRNTVIKIMDKPVCLDINTVKTEYEKLKIRLEQYATLNESEEIWEKIGFKSPEKVSCMETDDFLNECKKVFENNNRRKEDSEKKVCGGFNKNIGDKAEELLNKLFGYNYKLDYSNDTFTGYAGLDDSKISVLGIQNSAELSPEMLLRFSGHIIETIEKHPAIPVVFLADTKGQELSRRAETLGNNAYVSHFLKTVHTARQNVHKIISLVYGYGWGAAMIALGLSADSTYGLESSNIGEMTLQAMSKITLMPVKKLEELSKTCATFAPGGVNFMKLGGINEIWNTSDLTGKLKNAINTCSAVENRSYLGMKRNGRTLSYKISQEIINGS